MVGAVSGKFSFSVTLCTTQRSFPRTKLRNFVPTREDHINAMSANFVFNGAAVAVVCDKLSKQCVIVIDAPALSTAVKKYEWLRMTKH